MDITDLKSVLESRDIFSSNANDTLKIIKDYGHTLVLPESLSTLNPKAILYAIAMAESNLCNYTPIVDTSYMPDGSKFNYDANIRLDFKQYGTWSACTYSSWKLHYQSAKKFGYIGSPYYLFYDVVAIIYVVRLLNKALNDYIGTGRPYRLLEDVYKAYKHYNNDINDDNIKQSSIDTFMEVYNNNYTMEV